MSNQGWLSAYLGEFLIEQFLHINIAQMGCTPTHHDANQMHVAARDRGHEINPDQSVKPVFMPSAPGYEPIR